MIKKTITYAGFNGNEFTEDFYFHLTAIELTKLEARLGMDIASYAQKLASENSVATMIDFLEDMILSSYGKRSDNGKQFFKSPEARAEFEYSQAYAELFEEMLTNPQSAKSFGEGLATGVGRAKTPSPQLVPKAPLNKEPQGARDTMEQMSLDV